MSGLRFVCDYVINAFEMIVLFLGGHFLPNTVDIN
jgi:hypothetical protein